MSSPNTPGLRKLQGKQELENLISKVIEARNEFLAKKIPILVKIAPDLTTQDKIDISDVIINNPKCNFGLIQSKIAMMRHDFNLL